jgi:hypothetical protein
MCTIKEHQCLPGKARSWKRQAWVLLLEPSERVWSWPPFDFWTSSLQNCEIIYFCSFKSYPVG